MVISVGANALVTESAGFLDVDSIMNPGLGGILASECDELYLYAKGAKLRSLEGETA